MSLDGANEQKAPPQSDPRDDPRYRGGLALIQAGAWRKAIGRLEPLAEEYPDDVHVRMLLRDARFKAGLETDSKMRPVRSTFPWRRTLLQVLFVALLTVLVVQGLTMLQQRVSPLVAQAQAEQRLERLASDGTAYLESGDLERAEGRFEEVLVEDPTNAVALAGLERIAGERELEALYARAVAAQETGDLADALALLTDIAVSRPGYRDVTRRTSDIRRVQELDTLYAEAEVAATAGRAADAAIAFEQIRVLNTSYRRTEIEARLFELYLGMGRELARREPADPTSVSEALGYLNKALSLKPRDLAAQREKQLASLFSEGSGRFQQGAWDGAVAALSTLHEQDPGYQRDNTVSMLYDAYLRSGEQYEQGGDIYRAHDQYRRASQLPVLDTTLAVGRMAAIQPFLTPTPTPTITPTPNPTRRPATGGGGVALPTATPTALPLAAYRNQIVFVSANQQQLGLWVMDPDGGNRRYLGNSEELRKQYDALLTKESFSPDGRYQLFVRDVASTAQVFRTSPEEGADAVQLTSLRRLSYDPVWAPDSSRVAFVSQDEGSDDIWVVRPDGSQARNLTGDSSDFDKHPSWSPDSTRLVFWSNREGVKAIYVMDAEGRGVRRLGNNGWDEFDPIWIK
ncbi:MAG: hypothetical protein ACYC5M_11635 [Anaerolineae bacterium]